MKKWSLVLMVMVSIMVCLAPQAEAQLGWVMTGYLFGYGDSSVSSGSGDVLYQLDRLPERIEDPLSVRTTCLAINYGTGNISAYKRMSLRELFDMAMIETGIENADDGRFVLVRMRRVIRFDSVTIAGYWIEYIEKSKVLSDKELPDEEP